MSRVLIIYASAHGQTHRIAEAIAEHLRRGGHEVELGDALAGGLPPPEDYDAVLVGSRVHFGWHAQEVIEYIAAHRKALKGMITGFFSVSMAAAAREPGVDPDGYLQTLFRRVDWWPTRAVAFAGGLPYRKYSPLVRLVMKWISWRAGHPTDTSRNHELTDWDAVAGFASKIADELDLEGELAAAPGASLSAPLH